MTEYNRILNTLRQNGERITHQRRLVIETLLETRDHMTISAIHEHIASKPNTPALPEPTIYRILHWLKDLALVSQTDMAVSGVVYQVIGPRKHHHLVCLNCGSTIDVDDMLFDGIRRRLEQSYGFQARIDHMAIYGTCAECNEDIIDEDRLTHD